MQYSTSLTPAYFANVKSKLVDLLTKGAQTNYGIFSHWNGNTAVFEKGWVGYEALHFIQLR
jgi:hypothetical protein